MIRRESFFFNDTATTEIYTLSLHDALPIYVRRDRFHDRQHRGDGHHDARRHQQDAASDATRLAHTRWTLAEHRPQRRRDRKSTRLNSSHANISYAVFCLKKKKTHTCEANM